VWIRVLGSAAGGGVPQWNCGCANCQEARRGGTNLQPRSEDSLAVSVEGDRWLLVNCSPSVQRQIEAFPPLHPRAPRHSPIAAIVLSNGDLDHCLGLFQLRESQPLTVYATARVWEGLVERNAIFRTLKRTADQITWRPLELNRAVPWEGGLGIEARPIPGKLPLHLEGVIDPSPEDNVGLWLTNERDGRRVAYLSSVADASCLTESDLDVECLFFDGTFFTDDELERLGLGTRRAAEMAHLPIGGAAGSLARLKSASARRKIYTHINNTNPILRADSAERRAVERFGWEVAFDGMELRG
jgi:pyrroloquinoline quinone biosynthesis protein B